MNALFYVTAYHFANNEWWRFAITTPDSPYDRHAAVIDLFHKEMDQEARFTRVGAQFICLTPDVVWREL